MSDDGASERRNDVSQRNRRLRRSVGREDARAVSDDVVMVGVAATVGVTVGVSITVEVTSGEAVTVGVTVGVVVTVGVTNIVGVIVGVAVMIGVWVVVAVGASNTVKRAPRTCCCGKLPWTAI
jgi:hypothetical protein